MEMLWSPHDSSIFAIGCSEYLKLYEFGGARHAKQTEDGQGLQKHGVRLLSSVTDVQQLKCVAWSPDAGQSRTLAVGTAAGKVVLHDMLNSEGAPTSALCEFVPRFQRACFSLAWNETNRNQIAAGLDKVRGDSGVLIWDLNRQASAPAKGAQETGHLRPLPELQCGATLHSCCASDFSSCVNFDISSVGAVHSDEAPVAECGNTEAAVSVSWLPDEPHCLLVGTGFKWLRLYDLRTKPDTKLSCLAHAKAVYGVHFDPFDARRVATYSDDSEGIVKVWDMRRLRENVNEPVTTLYAAADDQAAAPQPSGRLGARGGKTSSLLQVGWCSTRRGMLSTVCEGSSSLCLWDVETALPPPQLEKPPQPSARQGGAGGRQCERIYKCEAPAMAFRWHPTQHSRMLLLLQGPRRGVDLSLKDLCLHPPTPLSWSPTNELLFAAASDAASHRQQLCLATKAADASLPPHAAPPQLGGTFAGGGAPPLLWHMRSFVDGAAAEHSSSSAPTAADVSQNIRRRAERGYGLDPTANLTMLERDSAADERSSADHVQLSAAWRWLATLDAQGAAHSPPPPTLLNAPSPSHRFHRGLMPSEQELRPPPPSAVPTLGSASQTASDEIALRGACDVIVSSGASEPVECSSGLSLYRSPARALVLRSCGWEECADPTALEASIRSLEDAGACERAAVLALLHAGAHPAYVELERVVLALNRGGVAAAAASQNERAAELRMMAMVVAGYQPSAKLWWSTVHATAQGAASPHLRLLLAVLSRPSARGTGGSDGVEAFTPVPAAPPEGEFSQLLIQALLQSHSDVSRADDVRDGCTNGGGGGGGGTLLFRDGLAMACRFLPDAELRALLPRLTACAVESGALQGIALTGMAGRSTLSLLQAHVDRTVDVQSAVLLLAEGTPKLLGRAQPCQWLAAYRDLLNVWQLHHMRCRLDIAIAARLRQTSAISVGGGAAPAAAAAAAAAASISMPPIQVAAKCKFCNAALTTGGGGGGGGTPRSAQPPMMLARAAESTLRRVATKPNACPKCKKPLPRCAVCLQHIGCPDPTDTPPAAVVACAAAAAPTSDAPRVWKASSSTFSHWTVWCQSCGHGGHADHMQQWFERHTECPVWDCKCRCKLRDVRTPPAAPAIVLASATGSP